MSNFLLIKYNDVSHAMPEYEPKRTISLFHGDPSISMLSNIMISSINGNSPIENSNVICISDFHYDTSHKYIRSGIVNEIIHSTNKMHARPIFLLEGTQNGHLPNEWVYNKLVGNGLIHFEHIAYGWDDMQMNNYGIKLIKEIQSLRQEIKEIERKYIILNMEKSKILQNCSMPAEQIFEMIDSIEIKTNTLVEEAEKTNKHIESIRQNINELSIARSDCLHKSIETVLQKFPESTIFVIGGEDHFKFISKYLKNTSHCILNIKETREIIDFDEAMKEVYGHASSSAFTAEEVD